MDYGIIISALSLVFIIFMAIMGGVVWLVRLEGELKLQKAQSANLKERCDSLQRQNEDYRSHTDVKIDALSRDIKNGLEKIYDRLDGKVDKE